MAPTAVLDKITITTIKMTTTTNNNLSAYIANTSVVNSVSFFGVFQDTAVKRREITIHSIILPTISAKPYRKAIISIIFFVAFSLSLLPLPFLLVIWWRRQQRISIFPQIWLNVKRSASWIRFATILFILKTTRASVFLILPVNSRWSRILQISKKILPSLRFVPLLWRVIVTSVFLSQTCHLNFH